MTDSGNLARQLVIDRIALGDDHQFVMRCHDGHYGPLVADTAVDVIARETVAGDEPTDAGMAEAIIAEVRQTAYDVVSLAA